MVYLEQVKNYFEKGEVESCVFSIDRLKRFSEEENLKNKGFVYEIFPHKLERDKLKLVIRGIKNA